MADHILVTGGLGYIGSHCVIELIEEGSSVVIVDNLNNSNIKCLDRLHEITGKPDQIVFKQIDLLDVKTLEEEVFKNFKISSVIHFAAHKAVGESVAKPLDYYHNNVCATVTLLKLMQKYGCKCFVFSSSACVYGENPECVEGDTIQPINPYG